MLAFLQPLFVPAFSLFGSAVTWLEIVAFVLSIWMVVCNIRVDATGWPLAIISSLLYFALFWQSRLYGDASLQLVFVVVAAWGWWQWLHGGTGSSGSTAALPPPVRAMTAQGRLRMLALLVVMWPLVGLFLHKATDTDVPWFDAFPTAASLIGQWLLGRKYGRELADVGGGQRRQHRAVRVQGALAHGDSVCHLPGHVVRGLACMAPAPGNARARRTAIESWRMMTSTNGRRAFVIGILGAESTGKTVLAADLAGALGSSFAAAARGTSVALVDEYLREFCTLHSRTPRQDEQAGIANEQTQRIIAAAASHDIVVADTTALMIAVYSDIVFDDTSLYATAEAAHRRCDLTLLTALDLPWQEDGLQRDGPHVREPVDALVRASLTRAGGSYAVIAGSGPARLEAALAAALAALRAASTASIVDPRAEARWSSVCERCGDPDCERKMLRLPR